MKVLVLVAGCIGAFAFFQPFFLHDDLPVSAYRILRGFEAHEVGLEGRPDELWKLNARVQREQPAAHDMPDSPSPVPYYFVSAIMFVVVGLVSLIRGRFSGFAGLISLSGAMLAIGGWMRETRIDQALEREGEKAMMTFGATLLLVSGLLGLVSSLVVLIKREPDRPSKAPEPPSIELPEARVVS
jgi:hypothetical protein